MARLSELVDAVAEVTGVALNNVNLHARLAREAGYIQQGGRGLSAPNMTARDAAMLLGAIMASPTAKETAITLGRMLQKNSVVMAVSDIKIPHVNRLLSPLCLRHSFIDGLEFFIDNYNSVEKHMNTHKKQASISVMLSDVPHIMLYDSKNTASNNTIISLGYGEVLDEQPGDFSLFRRITEKTIKAVIHTLAR